VRTAISCHSNINARLEQFGRFFSQKKSLQTLIAKVLQALAFMRLLYQPFFAAQSIFITPPVLADVTSFE
jgi:hypothetical protein